MIEEFDTIQSLNLSRSLFSAAAILVIAIILEVGLRFGWHWALSKNYAWLAAILGAANQQPARNNAVVL